MIYFAPKSIRPERVEIITILSGGDTTWPVYFAAFLFFFFIFWILLFFILTTYTIFRVIIHRISIIIQWIFNSIIILDRF